MASLVHHFLTMAYNNAWANHRLLKACLDLSQTDFIAPRTSFSLSIKATLNRELGYYEQQIWGGLQTAIRCLS